MATIEVTFPFRRPDDQTKWLAPGDKVDVDDATAVQKVADGHARLLDGKATRKASARKPAQGASTGSAGTTSTATGTTTTATAS